MKNLQFASRKAGSTGQDALPEYSILPQKRPGVTRDDTGDDTKRLAAAALSAVKEAAAAAALGKGKVGVITVFPCSSASLKFLLPTNELFGDITL